MNIKLSALLGMLLTFVTTNNCQSQLTLTKAVTKAACLGIGATPGELRIAAGGGGTVGGAYSMNARLKLIQVCQLRRLLPLVR